MTSSERNENGSYTFVDALQNVIEENQFDNTIFSDWESFWNKSGEEIVQRSWIRKYGDFIDYDFDFYFETVSLSEYLIESLVENLTIKDELWEEAAQETEIQLKQEEVNDYVGTYRIEWQQLWEENFEQTYRKRLHRFLKNSKNKLETTDDSEEDEEFELMKSLGLPTTFQSSKPKNTKRRLEKRKKDFERLETLLQAEGFLIAEEDEDSSDSEMERARGIHENLVHRLDKKSKKIQKRKNLQCSTLKIKEGIPLEITKNRKLMNFWYKRYSLFSRFDEGIQLDEESWFSVTPEKIAANIAEHFRFDLIVDGFCGCGGNTIQFALQGSRVIAIDIDPKKIEKAKHNAGIYGVADRIEFIVADFLQIVENLKADAIFLSPPWGGVEYKNLEVYDIENDMKPVAVSILMEKCRTFTENIALFLPRNINPKQLAKLTSSDSSVLINKHYLNNRLNSITAYFGRDSLICK